RSDPSWSDGGAFGTMVTTIVGPFALALALSLAIVPLCRLAALRVGFVAKPREDRWHRRPVALFGGVGIALVLFSCAAAFGVAAQQKVLFVTAMAMFAVRLPDALLAM